MIEITRAREATEELLFQINHLLPQLSSSASAMTGDELIRLLDESAVSLFVATHDGHVVGMLTLVVFPIPTGIRAWIEDVVVDALARGLGAGNLLTLAAIEYAKRRGALTVDLTSRPAREAANALYRKVGFVQRETNVYRFLVEVSDEQ